MYYFKLQLLCEQDLFFIKIKNLPQAVFFLISMTRTVYICVNIELNATNRKYRRYTSCIPKLPHVERVQPLELIVIISVITFMASKLHLHTAGRPTDFVILWEISQRDTALFEDWKRTICWPLWISLWEEHAISSATSRNGMRNNVNEGDNKRARLGYGRSIALRISPWIVLRSSFWRYR